MSCITFIKGHSLIHSLDPRTRLLAALAASITIAIAETFPALWAGLFCGVLLASTAQLPARATIKRLLGLNCFMLILWILVPTTTPGAAVYTIGQITISLEGLQLATRITLKGNAIVLIYTALLSTIEISDLGHALAHLHIPVKLAHLFLFTIRYIDIIHHEYHRMATAMKTRCFRPRMNLHTYSSFGYVVAMLLTRSLDRSERIIAAMKCRGFKGKFYIFNHFKFAPRDLAFGIIMLIALSGIIIMEHL
ncbi:MAG: cobalt ECF transporter T component CbiQ [Kiritimatiellae bacterium]|nr:cobalt ECF transporter T component CbiQ [Kiritimatiellia bacterium]